MSDQASANYDWFKGQLADLLKDHRGQHVLIHNQKPIAFFEESLPAILEGYKQFGEGNFSVESVDNAVEDLGFFSHVASSLHA